MYVEPAKIEDVSIIAKIHCSCWQDTYKFIPKEIHDARSFEFRQTQWTKVVTAPKYGERLFALKTDEHAIAGFTYCRPNTDDDIQATSELHATYVLKRHRGGVSGPLLKYTAMRYLENLGRLPMCFWAFDKNRPAMIIYKSWGWVQTVKRDRVINGVSLPETGFLHPDYDTLFKRLENYITSKQTET